MNFEGWGALIYLGVSILAHVMDVPVIAVILLAFCSGFFAAFWFVGKGWSKYYSPDKPRG